ncbi:uncharacterized protein E5676_scaffold10G00190 [Cucumis melo var. makuwa]|uniref:Uncharacterized protein n=1 Tax=Cucumis melo var. makuwa TaxID=1194695 RepID=A0A5A7UG90_CUCMM|nr:uncharacterized protein E6C27_scaffold318G001300 [Cucumis melo var. makuwa]TYJ96864.1 uncharacterized protein E5676_scaffold10G00190 [Cucumis melo var. makuwa]
MCYDHVSSVLVQVRLAGIVVYENDICWLHTAFQAESRWSRRGVTLLANHTSTHHRCPRFMDWHPFMHRCLLTLYSSCISMVLGSIEGTQDVTSYFDKFSLLWKEIDLYRETIWDTLNDGIQYARLEEVERIYDFLAVLNLKFDIVGGRILRQRPIPSLVEVCYKVRLEEDHTNVISVLTTSTIDSSAFSAQS